MATRRLPASPLAIYDPSLNLSYALKNSYTRMVDINASGMTSINLGLRVRRDVNGVEVLRLRFVHVFDTCAGSGV
jgi:hypothetical protein